MKRLSVRAGAAPPAAARRSARRRRGAASRGPAERRGGRPRTVVISIALAPFSSLWHRGPSARPGAPPPAAPATRAARGPTSASTRATETVACRRPPRGRRRAFETTPRPRRSAPAAPAAARPAGSRVSSSARSGATAAPRPCTSCAMVCEPSAPRGLLGLERPVIARDGAGRRAGSWGRPSQSLLGLRGRALLPRGRIRARARPHGRWPSVRDRGRRAREFDLGVAGLAARGARTGTQRAFGPSGPRSGTGATSGETRTKRSSLRATRARSIHACPGPHVPAPRGGSLYLLRYISVG